MELVDCDEHPSRCLVDGSGGRLPAAPGRLGRRHLQARLGPARGTPLDGLSVMESILTVMPFVRSLFYYFYVPTALHTFPLHFNFHGSDGVGEALPHTHLRIAQPEDELLANNQPYNFFVDLELPETPVNVDCGMVMVTLALSSHGASRLDVFPDICIRALTPVFIFFRTLDLSAAAPLVSSQSSTLALQATTQVRRPSSHHMPLIPWCTRSSLVMGFCRFEQAVDATQSTVAVTRPAILRYRTPLFAALRTGALVVPLLLGLVGEYQVRPLQ